MSTKIPQSAAFSDRTPNAAMDESPNYYQPVYKNQLSAAKLSFAAAAATF
jgi:hypothetical protein